MKYIVIAGTSTSLPFAVEVDTDSIEDAVSQAIPTEDVDLTLSPILVVNKETGDVKRPYRTEDGWMVSDTAFDRLGVFTPDEYFEKPETTGMDL